MPKRLKEELLAQYELEPTIRDIFVEGITDKFALDSFFKEHNLKNVQVYNIDTVDIPNPIQLGNKQGNKDRVITLARFFDAEVAPQSSTCTCVIDKDCDNFLNINWSNKFLLTTDFTSIDVYPFEKNSLEEFFRIFIRTSPEIVDHLLEQFEPVLKELFMMRVARESLGINKAFCDFTKYCKLENNKINFNRDRFINTLLTSKAWAVTKPNFEKEIEKHRKKITNEIRNQTHNADIFLLLSWWLHKKYGVKHKYNPETLKKVLFLCLKLQDLTNYNLFKVLKKRASQQP